MLRISKIAVSVSTGILTLICSVSAEGELADNSTEDAFSFEAAYVSDYVNNFTGAVKRGRTYLGLIDIGISFNTEAAGLWKGGELFIQVENTHGGTPTADLVHDFQVFSNIENGDNTYLYMAWIMQKFGGLSLLAGIHDLNSAFHISEYAGLFINSSFGIMSSMAVNVPVPIFPKTALGFIARYDVTEQFAIQTAIYDGDPGDLEDDPYNLDHSLGKDQGFLNVNELHYTTVNGKGIYKAGVYYHSAEYVNYSDTTGTVNGNYGLYIIGDQLLLPEAENENQGLGAFLQLGWAPAKYNFNSLYIGAGFSYSGLFTKRHDDALGVGIAYAKVCDKYLSKYSNDWRPNETTVEITYMVQINENIAIQPDIQYIINPGATKTLDNAFVGLLRLNIGF